MRTGLARLVKFDTGKLKELVKVNTGKLKRFDSSLNCGA